MQNKDAYISQKEIPFPPGEVLISKTDTKGVITYANDAFVRMSGFTREELMGRSHNLVRHPDMPQQTFAWLWDTLKQDRPWRGMVKNRCKNGDHYWARSTIAPVIENGKISGFVSVRREPTRQQVADAESYYKRLNQSGEAIVSPSERYRFKNWSLKTKLQAVILIPLAIFFILLQIGIWTGLKRDMVERASEKGELVANQIIDGANILMLTGQISEVENRKMLLTKATASGGVIDAQLLRAKKVIDLYGNGRPEEFPKDELQRQVMDSKKANISLVYAADGSPRLRVVTPYFASKDFHGTDCTGCHQAEEGAVLGASDVLFDLAPDMAKTRTRSWELLGGQVLLLIALYYFIGYSAHRYIRRPLHAVDKEFRSIMEGDLDAELDISSKDEMGRLLCELQSMQTYLRTMVDEIALPVKKMQQRIGEVDDKVNHVAENVLTEKDHIQKIATSMDQFSKSVSGVADMAANSLQGAQQMRSVVDENNRNMELSVQAAGRVSDTVQASSKTISDLGDSIKRIGAIANTIKEIADQTNLLALNAAIEAARAGEQGRGFAVVADEVRKLAERTATSTKDITRTITEISSISAASVTSMQEAVSEVENSIALIRQNGEGLKQILQAAQDVSGHVENIAEASKEQSATGESVASSLDQIAELVDNNAISAQDTQSATEELAKSADELSRAGYPLTKCAMGK